MIVITACATVNKMDIESEIMDNKGKIRMNELGIKALVNLLSKEGLFSNDDFEEELKNLIKIKEIKE